MHLREHKIREMDSEQKGEQCMDEERCRKFIIVNDHQVLEIPPFQDKYMTPPSNEPHDKRNRVCQVNTTPLVDEYEVNNSEDKVNSENNK